MPNNEIPGPKGLPFLGNVFDMDFEMPIRGVERLAEQYGPIYQISVAGNRQIICSSAELMEELTDERRFVKVPPAALTTQPGVKGLFSARNEDPDWAQAHRILMPSFAPLAVQDMFEDMKDIANQLVLAWARKGPDHVITATEDFTRLTLDTIALCTMDYRFNSFYAEKMHPFVDAMLGVLSENSARAARPNFISKMMVRKDRKHEENKAVLRNVGQEIINHRRENPKEGNDILNAMIYGKDPKTGEVMRDDLIAAQMTTFLIAGHETTSGLLSFALLHLLQKPETYFKAQQEIDRVIGNRAIEFKDLKELAYLTAVLREAIRLNPTVPALSKEINPAIREDVVTLGGYVLKPTDRLVILLTKSQTDPHVWGDDANEFNPDRMLDAEFEKVAEQYPGSWKPFGNGKRACIGRGFAWQEAQLVLAVLLQNFDIQLNDPSYKLKIKQTLTIKPDNFEIRVKPRNNATAVSVNQLVHGGQHTNGQATNGHSVQAECVNGAAKKPLTVLYGSNTGTCQAFAQRAAADAVAHGFTATVLDMDSGLGLLTKGTPVIIFTSSYEGEPPDNAVKFMGYLQSAQAESLAGVEYAVFGCGHRDWTRTFHRIPKLADELLAKAGAKRIVDTGFTDAAKGNMYGDFEDWLDTKLWPALRTDSPPSSGAEDAAVEFELSTDARATALRFDVQPATVIQNIKLTSGDEAEKFHIEIALPSDATYECGDYLAVLPQNSEEAVRGAMAHFNVPWDTVITIKGEGPSALPLNSPVPVAEILRSYVELSQPVTKKTIRLLTTYTTDAPTLTHLTSLTTDSDLFSQTITNKRTSLLTLLTTHPTIHLPLGLFLTLLPPLQVRQYSISSSPLSHPTSCTLTYAILSAPSHSDPAALFHGVTSTYLRSLRAGDQLQCAIRPCANKLFRLPPRPEATPVLMFAAGTGIAPFRGFCLQRAAMMKAGGKKTKELAEAVLFVGCRGAERDRLYAEEVDGWVRDGVVKVRYAFSRDVERSAVPGKRYVGELLGDEGIRREVLGLWKAGARVYVCGSRGFAGSVREGAVGVGEWALKERERNGEVIGEEEREAIEERFREAMRERVASDVFD